MEEKNLLSPWAACLIAQLAGKSTPAIAEKVLSSRSIRVVLTQDSLVAVVNKAGGAQLIFRMVYTPAADLTLGARQTEENGYSYVLRSSLGCYQVVIRIADDGDIETLRYTVNFTPEMDLVIPYWPKDILALTDGRINGDVVPKIHVEQQGMRSGVVYFSIERPDTGGILYLQNVSVLNDYCEDTGVSVADTVRGGWPELGFAPPTAKDKPLKGGKTYGISDAFVAFADGVPDSQFAVARQFTRLLAHVYLLLSKPPTTYHDYPSIAEKVLAGLDDHKGCWSHHHGFDYLNAYVCDYQTPPEIMVQLAVLLPTLEYADWAGRRPALAAKLEAGLATFYDANLGTVRRWLPAATDQLDGSEEHKKELVMDSWYLHHPLLNLSRMALRGDETAKKLFLQSLDYTIKVGRHFKYQWPIFYKMDTLEVVKAEAAPGDGGEKDVPGIYAHVMLQAWELTGKRTYFEEAERAVKTMASEGFDLFYQANNTAFSAGAMLRMWKETGHEKYLDMSYLLMGGST